MSVRIEIKKEGNNLQGYPMYTLYAPIKVGSGFNQPVAKEVRFCNGLKEAAIRWCKTHGVDHYFNEEGRECRVDLT